MLSWELFFTFLKLTEFWSHVTIIVALSAKMNCLFASQYHLPIALFPSFTIQGLLRWPRLVEHLSVACGHCALAPDPFCFAIGDEWDPGSALRHSGCERTLWNDLWGLHMLWMLWGEHRLTSLLILCTDNCCRCTQWASLKSWSSVCSALRSYFLKPQCCQVPKQSLQPLFVGLSNSSLKPLDIVKSC